MIVISGLKKIYGSGRTQTAALDGVSLALPDRGMVFVLGKSGCGKTTLLNMLGAMDTFEGGEITVDGRALSGLTRRERDAYRNTYVGFVFQEYNLIEDFTVGQNIAVAQELQRKKPDGAQISALLERLEIGGLEERRITELSGGQRQRVAIVRALIKQPRLLLCDEPTGALDSASGESLMRLLKSVSGQRLVVVVTHDRDFAARFGDRVIELKDGKVVADSAPLQPAPPRSGLALTYAKLGFRSAVRMGVRTAVKRPVRLALSVLLLALATFVLGVAVVMASFDYGTAVARTILRTGRQYNSVTAGYLFADGGELEMKADDALADEFSGMYSLPVLPAVYTEGATGAFYGELSFKGSVFRRENSVRDYLDFDNDMFFNCYIPLGEGTAEQFGFTLEGSLPEGDEIVITRYNSRAFETYGLNEGGAQTRICGPADLIGKKIAVGRETRDGAFTADGELTVSGVITSLDIPDAQLNKKYVSAARNRKDPDIYADQFNFLRDEGIANACFVSPEKFASLAAANADLTTTTGLVRAGAELTEGEPDFGDEYKKYVGDTTATGLGHFYCTELVIVTPGQSAVPMHAEYFGGTAPASGEAALGLFELFSLVNDADIPLSAEDAAQWGTETLGGYIDEYFYGEDNLLAAAERLGFSGEDAEWEAEFFYGEMRAGRYCYRNSEGELIEYARECYSAVAPVIEKYAAGMQVNTDNGTSLPARFSLCGVVFLAAAEGDCDYLTYVSYTDGGIIQLCEADAGRITCGAFGNCYDFLVSPMPSGVGGVRAMFDAGGSKAEGVRFAMSEYESLAVNEYLSSAVANKYIAAGLGGIMALLSLLIIFNLIANGVAIRQKDIAVLRNLGAGRAENCKIFYAEGVLVAVLAAAVSAVLTAVGLYLINRLYAAGIFDCLVCAAFEWWVPLLILGIVLAVTFGVTWLALAAKLRKK